MIKFDTQNVVQTQHGDTLSIGVGMKGCPCCADTFKVTIFGNEPRTYNMSTFTKDELVKLGDIIQRLING